MELPVHVLPVPVSAFMEIKELNAGTGRIKVTAGYL